MQPILALEGLKDLLACAPVLGDKRACNSHVRLSRQPFEEPNHIA